MKYYFQEICQCYHCPMPPSLAKSTQKPAFRLTEEISGLIEATEI